MIGHRTGTTVLNIWVADPEDPERERVLSYLVRVIPDPERKDRLERVYEALEEEINRNFPDSVVRLSLVADKLMIRGQAKDIEDAAQILRIVGHAAPDGPVEIPIEPAGPPPQAAEAFRQQFEFMGPPPAALEDFIIETQPDSPVINMLRIPGHHQVMLQVTVAEVSRNALRSIGAGLAIGDVQNPASFFSFTPDGAAGS